MTTKELFLILALGLIGLLATFHFRHHDLIEYTVANSEIFR